MMRFSIVIPVWNNEEWLSKCFDSILNQTYTNYEVIIVDDMSTDNGMKIIKEYQKKFNNKCKGCKVFKNKTRRLNGGSRNVGISESQGEYIMCIDCDDWLSDNQVLEDINNKLNNEDIMFLDYVVHTKDYDMNCTQHYESIEQAIYGFTCALWTKVVKRELLLNNLQKEGTLFEDLGQHYRILLNCKTFTYLGRASHIWNRLNNNSISKMSQYEFYRFNFCGEIYELIREQPEGKIKDYLKKKLHEYLDSCNDMVNKL